MAGNKLVFFFLSGVLLSAACGNNIEELKKQIKLVKEQTIAIEADSRELQARILNLPDLYKKKILDATIEKYDVSDKIKKETILVHELRSNITLSEIGVRKTNDELASLGTEISKLNFFIEWVTQDLAKLKLRRSNNESVRCFELMHPSIHHVTFGQRSLLDDYENDNTTIVRELTQELVEATKDYERAVIRNSELNVLLNKDTESWEGKYQSAVRELDNALKQLTSAQKLVKALKEKSANVTKSFSELKTSLNQFRDKAKDRRRSAKATKDEYQQFTEDSACYAKLEQEILKQLP